MKRFRIAALTIFAAFALPLLTDIVIPYAPAAAVAESRETVTPDSDSAQTDQPVPEETGGSSSSSGNAGIKVNIAFAAPVPLSAAKPLPIDFTPGMPPDPRGYISDTEYSDPTIHVKIRKDRKNECDVWIADIEIADASQLRTAAADGFDSNMVMPGPRLAERMNAVLAVEGDYFCYTGKGLIVRQGKKYLDRLKNRDVLVIDEDGDFIGFEDPPAGSIGEEVNGKKVINAFFFGPLLVNNGKIRTGGFANGMMYKERCQRMAIAQTGHLKYRVIACGPNVRGSVGMTVDEFRNYIAAMPDVKVAYNMDGGDSTMIIFNGKKVNDPDNPDSRDVADIVYFASAYTGEA